MHMTYEQFCMFLDDLKEIAKRYYESKEPSPEPESAPETHYVRGTALQRIGSIDLSEIDTYINHLVKNPTKPKVNSFLLKAYSYMCGIIADNTETTIHPREITIREAESGLSVHITARLISDGCGNEVSWTSEVAKLTWYGDEYDTYLYINRKPLNAETLVGTMKAYIESLPWNKPNFSIINK
jgi:hypothetical protein